MTGWDLNPLEAAARIRRFSTSCGFFCDIRFVLTPSATGTREVAGVEVPDHLRSGIAFGVDHALSKAGYLGGWLVEVKHFERHEVDTTVEVVALAAAQAVLEALGEADKPCLDIAAGIVGFRK